MKGVYLLLASVAVVAIFTGSDAAPDPKPVFWFPYKHTAEYHRRRSTAALTSAATSAGSASTAASDSANPSPTPTAAPVGR